MSDRRSLIAAASALLASLGATAFVAVSASAADERSVSHAETCQPQPARASERLMTHLVNGQRARAGLPRLEVRPDVRAAGKRHSRWMAATGRFEHEATLAWARGQTAGQNIARGSGPGSLMRAMMRSRGHRANLLRPLYRHVGVGATRDCDGYTFYTINLLG